MLDFMRKRKRSWFIIFILSIAVIVFVFFGLGGNVGQPRLESVAEVNDEKISPREFRIHYERLIEFYRDLFKGGLTQETIKALNLKKVLLRELIEKRLLLQEARRLGLEVTDEELVDAIAQVPDLQISGRFSRERYQQFLRFKRLTPEEFEVEQRHQLTIQKLYDIIQNAVYVTEAELKERYRLEQERINLYFVRLSPDRFIPQVKMTAEEIKDTYERNKETLKEPLRVQVEYLAYPYAPFSSKVQVSQKEIEDFYTTHREKRFHQPKAVRVRHILFRIPTGADAKQKEVVHLKADGVLRQVRAGRDFAQLAKAHSEEPSAAQGGDVGWLAQGQMLPPLEKAAFALSRGEISDVVETSLGYHLLKVEEAREAKTKSLKEATEEIIRALKNERGKAEAAKAVDTDRERALSGTDLSKLAKERGLPIILSPFFARSEVLPEVGTVEEFNKVAFSLSLKEVSPAIEGPNAYYLLKVKERKEPSVPNLDLVRSRLEKNLREAKALELAIQRANRLLGELRKEKEIEKLARQHGLEVEETGWFLRSASQIPKIGILQEVKGGAIPISVHQPIPERIYTQREAVYLLAFKDSRGADMELFEKEKLRLQEQALKEKGQRTLQRFVDSLKSGARIVPNAKFFEES